MIPFLLIVSIALDIWIAAFSTALRGARHLGVSIFSSSLRVLQVLTLNELRYFEKS